MKCKTRDAKLALLCYQELITTRIYRAKLQLYVMYPLCTTAVSHLFTHNKGKGKDDSKKHPEHIIEDTMSRRMNQYYEYNFYLS